MLPDYSGEWFVATAEPQAELGARRTVRVKNRGFLHLVYVKNIGAKAELGECLTTKLNADMSDEGWEVQRIPANTGVNRAQVAGFVQQPDGIPANYYGWVLTEGVGYVLPGANVTAATDAHFIATSAASRPGSVTVAAAITNPTIATAGNAGGITAGTAVLARVRI